MAAIENNSLLCRGKLGRRQALRYDRLSFITDVDMNEPPDSSEHTAAPESPHRSVRSFVIRGGRLTEGQERALTQLWPQYGIDHSPSLLDLDRHFGRSAPRLLEIGFGAGEALLEFAVAHPEIDCLGVEVHRPGIGRVLMHAQAKRLTNVRVICHDVVEVLQRQIASDSLDLIHIFFPDPWHKKRHHKRRLIQPAFVALLVRVLKSGGTLRLATDWEDYATQMLAVVSAHPSLHNIASSGEFSDRLTARPLTRFERRGQRLGHGVWDLQFTRL
jgi:tRNA (guanine-N7-)-methyltransferase